MQDFSVEGGPQNVWGVRFFEDGTKFYYWAALKFGVIFQKSALKLMKICKIIGKFEKNANSRKIF